MDTIILIAYQIILPVFLVAGIGMWFGRRFDPDQTTFSRLAIYLLMPSLILDSLSHSQLDWGEMGQVGMVVFLLAAISTPLGWLFSRTQTQLDRPSQSAFLLSAVLINTGNYGLPVIDFAFGAQGLERGAVVVVCTTMVSYSLGVYLASWGQASVWESLKNVFRTPLLYAAILGLLLNILNIPLPLPIERGIGLLSQATVPIILLLLGIQLGQVRAIHQFGERLGAVLWASGFRLVGVPCLVYAITWVLGIHGLTQQVLLIQLSMPTAVNAALLATEFGSDREFINQVILITTIGSIPTLSVLLALVR